MIGRRSFVAGSLTLFAATPTAAQPPGRRYRVGWLAAGSPSTFLHLVDAVRQGLRERGYVEGQNLILDIQAAEGQADRLPAIAVKLVASKPDVIIAAVTQTTQVARQATSTIPIVMVGVTNPVDSGFVESFARPGGNITGLAGGYGDAFAAKWLEVIKEAVPKATVVGVIYNSTSTGTRRMVDEVDRAAPRFKVGIHHMGAPRIEGLESAFASVPTASVDALIVVPDPLTFSNRWRLLDLAARHRLPAVYGWREAVNDGGFISYGTDQRALFRRAADYIDRILKGTKPGDIPVEQPTTFELVINLKTARALGVTIPPALVLRADHVIQ